MKTADNYFRGFPGGMERAGVLSVSAAARSVDRGVRRSCCSRSLTFLPVPFVHPFRVARLRVLNIALLVVWAVLAFVALLRDMIARPLGDRRIVRHRALFPGRRTAATAR